MRDLFLIKLDSQTTPFHSVRLAQDQAPCLSGLWRTTSCAHERWLSQWEGSQAMGVSFDENHLHGIIYTCTARGHGQHICVLYTRQTEVTKDRYEYECIQWGYQYLQIVVSVHRQIYHRKIITYARDHTGRIRRGQTTRHYDGACKAYT